METVGIQFLSLRQEKLKKMRGATATLLKLIGGIWVLIGVANIVFVPWSRGSAISGILTFALIFDFVLFILAGLIVYFVNRSRSSTNKA